MSAWPLGGLIALFGLCGILIGLGGVRMASLADRLADRTGLGEAMMGGVFLGVTTSLPGISASVTAALDGYPSLAISNAMGGIAVQTAFLAVADLFHRRANLEHAAASAPNLVQSTLLVTLLCLVLLSMSGPDWTIGHVHPGTPILLLSYLFGLRLAFRTSRQPMWIPSLTQDTVEDRPSPDPGEAPLTAMWLQFSLAALVVMAAGVAIAHTAGVLVSRTGLSETVMGAVFTGVVTSLPELVTTIAAVRRGALTLAVSDIVGGNAFDVLFVCVADTAYLKGSIFHAVGASEVFLVGLTMLLNLILLMGLIQRQQRGIANIGFESLLILIVYAAGISLLTSVS